MSDDAIAKYHIMSIGLEFQSRKVFESNIQTLPSKKLSSTELSLTPEKPTSSTTPSSIVKSFTNTITSRSQITIHKSNPQLRNIAQSVASSFPLIRNLQIVLYSEYSL